MSHLFLRRPAATAAVVSGAPNYLEEMTREHKVLAQAHCPFTSSLFGSCCGIAMPIYRVICCNFRGAWQSMRYMGALTLWGCPVMA